MLKNYFPWPSLLVIVSVFMFLCVFGYLRHFIERREQERLAMPLAAQEAPQKVDKDLW
jgi:hypothetical protein